VDSETFQRPLTVGSATILVEPLEEATPIMGDHPHPLIISGFPGTTSASKTNPALLTKQMEILRLKKVVF
jgi:hypothetical protein